MKNDVIVYSVILLFGVFLGSVSQVLLKLSAKKKYENKLKEYLNPLVVIAYVVFVGTTFLSIIAYKVIPLSMGPVLEATSYIYITIFGVIIFKEKVDKKKLLALLLIVIGIMVYSFLG